MLSPLRRASAMVGVRSGFRVNSGVRVWSSRSVLQVGRSVLVPATRAPARAAVCFARTVGMKRSRGPIRPRTRGDVRGAGAVVRSRMRRRGATVVRSSVFRARASAASMDWAAGRPGRHHAPSAKGVWSLGRRDLRTTAVHGSSQLMVASSHLGVLALHGSNLNVTVVSRRQLGGVRTRRQPTCSAVEADVIDVIHHDGLVVDVGDSDVGYVGHRAVVYDVTTAPIRPLKTNTTVAKPVVHATIESHVRTPIARMPEIGTAVPAPIAGSPQISRSRRQHPGAGHPVVVVITPRPVARGPDVVRSRRGRLNIDRQGRWRDGDRDTDSNAGERRHRKRRQRERRNEAAKKVASTHEFPLRSLAKCAGGDSAETSAVMAA